MEYDPMMDYGNLPDMDEDDIDYGLELIKWADKIAKEELAKEDDKDYVVNQKQMETFLRVQLYFMKLVEPKYGEWVHANTRSPKERNGYITVKASMVDFTSAPQKIAEFCEMIGEAVTFGIDTVEGEDFFTISLVIPDIFVKKSPESTA